VSDNFVCFFCENPDAPRPLLYAKPPTLQAMTIVHTCETCYTRERLKMREKAQEIKK
jgi:hypothetical protein